MQKRVSLPRVRGACAAAAFWFALAAGCGSAGHIDPCLGVRDGTLCGDNWLCLASQCIENRCGDGFVAGREHCDDGNTSDGDGCSADCLVSTGVRVTPTFNNCPEITKISATPSHAVVGETVVLKARATDPEGDKLIFSWSADTGEISDPTAAETTFSCSEVGPLSLTLLVSDTGGCTQTAEFVFQCVAMP